MTQDAPRTPYPPIADYGLIGDCHSAALVSRAGSIDWCCLPRFDSDSCFGRLLDWREGGFFAIAPAARVRDIQRTYRASSLVLATTFHCEGGTLRLTDFFSMRRGGREHPRRKLVRIVETLEGEVPVRVTLSPRLDYGAVKPWIYRSGATAFIAVGSNTALRIEGDVALELAGKHDLQATFVLGAGRRAHVTMRFIPPEHADEPQPPDRATAVELLDETLAWWSEWSAKLQTSDGGRGPGVARSAITLKALTYAPTGAIIAAPTTSLPEAPGGERNWDYRFSWIRDSVFTVRTLSQLGCVAEADGFRRFVQRSAAGTADELQVMFAVDGKRRLTEIQLPDLEGWRGARPVRIGNAAAEQFQSDMYGLLLGASWRWCQRGNKLADDDWAFLSSVVDAAQQRWASPDHGLWEVRDLPRHFVHSKVMCWAAINDGLQLAQAYDLPAPLDAWRSARAAIHAAVMADGVDPARGVFVAAFGGRDLDAALLLLPLTGFIAFDDPLMIRTTQAIREELTRDGLVLRYRLSDGLEGDEGVFLPCSFWLVECLARQNAVAQARALFDRVCTCANDLGLFAEEYDPAAREMLGNFPQGLTHLAHVAASLALDVAERRR